MIITLQDTETREISAKIDELHEERGEAALGRVLTLLISTNEAGSSMISKSPTMRAASIPAV